MQPIAGKAPAVNPQTIIARTMTILNPCNPIKGWLIAAALSAITFAPAGGAEVPQLVPVQP